MTNGNTFYVASNDGNPQMRIGATDAEELHIQTVYDSGAQTLDYVIFQTDAASGTADKGEFRFNVDGTEIFHVNDSGVNVVSGKAFYINDTSVLNATTLGGAVVNSSLTSVGTLTTLTVDNVIVNGTTIGHTSDTDLMTLASGVLTVAGEISVTTLDIGGTNVTSTAAELNYVDVTAGTATASKAVVLDGSNNIATLGTVGCGAITSTGNSTFDSTTLVIDSSNDRVGIGIGSPTVSLDVTKSGSSNYINVSVGTVFNYFGVSNSGVIGTIGTVTNHPLRFDTNNTERVRIEGGGAIGIGLTAPSARLHLKYASNMTESSAHFKIEGSGYTGAHFLDATAYYIGQNSSGRTLRLYSNAETAGAELASGGTSFGTFSDERVKTGVMKIENAVSDLMKLRCVKFNYKMDPETQGKRLGLIAQDLLGVFDEAVYKGQGWGDLIQDENEYYSVTYTDMIPPIIAAIQELSKKIDAL